MTARAVTRSARFDLGVRLARERGPALCPRCGVRALLPLDAATAAARDDDTLLVCHPLLAGCNVGFGLIETGGSVL